jgi:hypothetical protein
LGGSWLGNKPILSLEIIQKARVRYPKIHHKSFSFLILVFQFVLKSGIGGRKL